MQGRLLALARKIGAIVLGERRLHAARLLRRQHGEGLRQGESDHTQDVQRGWAPAARAS